MQGVFLDRESLDRGDLDLQPLYDALPEWQMYPATRPADTASRLRNANVVVSNKVVLDQDVLEAAENLQLVCIAATGTNNIDLETAGKRGLTVCNVTGYATRSVVEYVFAQLLSLYRQLPAYRAAVRAGKWQQSEHFCLLDYPIRELHGQTLGIIGYGELGHAVARTGEAFGMHVLVAERANAPLRDGRTPLETVLAESHVLSLHCPLTARTRNLIGANELARMRGDAVLVNTARGGIVDESALLHALETGQIAGAIVDVLDVEPPRRGNPLLDAELPNLHVTPHIAWASTASRQQLANELAKNIRAWRSGTPRNVVSP
jgi:glycerate dehydrogenase